ncbi:hypothetical protein Q7P37_001820 [Cladosporium fusiforme]
MTNADSNAHGILASRCQPIHTTSAEATSGTNLGSLGRLPLELREIVYKYAIDARVIQAVSYLESTAPEPLLTWIVVDEDFRSPKESRRRVLRPLQVCSEMRSEAIKALSRVPILFSHHPVRYEEYGTPIAPPSDRELEAWKLLVSRIPCHLLVPRTTFEYQHDCGLDGPDPSLNDKTWGDGQQFSNRIRQLVDIVRPGKLKISIQIRFLKVGILGLQKDGGHPLRNARSFTDYICKRDTAITTKTSELLEVIVPADDPVKARRIVIGTFEAKRQLFEAHRGHKLCFVRLNIDKTLERLAISEKKMLDMVCHLPTQE